MVRITVRGVTVEYDGVKALDDVSLEVAGGEVTSIVGPNGSGKTTLLRCIDNILRPKLGVVLIDGSRIDGLSPAEAAKIVGYVPQSSPPAPFTAFEAVLMGRRPYVTWSLSSRDVEAAYRALEAVGARCLADRYLDELSGGEKQKVMVARALAQEPQVLLLDEPTSNLDVRHQLELLSLVKELASARGLCVLLAMHDLTLAYRFSDKVIMLKDGRVYAAGSPSLVLTRENIMEVYGVDALVLSNPVPAVVPLSAAGR